MAAPDRAGYLVFIRGTMGIGSAVLPDNSPAIDVSLSVALAFVSDWLNSVSPFIYTLAVYNLAGDRLLNFAQDQTGQSFFTATRASLELNSFVAGVIQASGDEGTNDSFSVPDQLKQLTLLDLQNLKTPYGRAYLQFAQQTGTMWGLT